MKKTTRRWLAVCGFLLIAGFAMLNVLAYNHAHAMMRFTAQGVRTGKPERLMGWAKLRVLLLGINIPRPSASLPPSALDSECQVLTVSGTDGVNLSCWYCNRGTGTPLVILFHGYSAEKTSLIREAKAFLDLGASVLLVDFRGSGGSSESYTTIGVGEADDVAATVQYARQHLGHSRVILFGQSMGAVAVLRAVDQHGVSPDAVIAEAVFDTMLNTVCNRFSSMRLPSFPSAQLLVFWGGLQCGFNGFRHNPVDYAKAIRCPALFMHGTDDPRATLVEGRRVFDVVPGSKEFRTFDRTGHESYVSTHAAEWRTVVADFMMKAESKRDQQTAAGKVGSDPWQKVELDLTLLDQDGLRGPPGGKVSVAYEFCIPNRDACRAEVRAIAPNMQFMPGSRGRIGAGKDECLCIGTTGKDFRDVLKRLAELPYVKRIIECHFE